MYSSAAAISVSWPAPVPWSQRSSSFPSPQRQAAGAQLLRGGAYKPRTSPYSFSGLREEGLALLRTALRETGLPVVSEIMSATDLPLFEDVDILQVGARNMQNYDLLRALGRCRKPVLLKRGPAATVQELLLSASTFSPAATKTSFSASGASAPSAAAPAAPWISPPFPCSTS